jgi:uncharacterized protein YndB with AHSA1/START domain
MTHTREHVNELLLSAEPRAVFDLLITPSAIRSWWGVARAIVLPRVGGLWAAAWGESEDDPDYVTVATIRAFDPPHRLHLADMRYHAKAGPLPFQAKIELEFTVNPAPGGAILRAAQRGIPSDPVADDYYAACERGWQATFEGIRRYLAERPAGTR